MPKLNSLVNQKGFVPLLIILPIATLIIGAFIGYSYAKKSGGMSPLLPNGPTTNNPAKTTEQKKLFVSQTANVFGTITKLDGQNITIQSTDGSTADFFLDPQVKVVMPSAATKDATPSSDIKLLKVGVYGSFILSDFNGEYKITTAVLQPVQPSPNLGSTVPK